MNWQDKIYESLTEVKSAAAHSIDVYDRMMGGTAKTAPVGAGETRRAETATKASDKAKKRRSRRLKAVTFGKGQRIFRHPVGSYKPS